ncbi:aminotransferase class V-fold PLP-dependent enzyme [Winogradskyella sp. R77965]|uniref:aminotransferase class V-fold PLP-dependent enzyme n=1 Tax=Winogradskyella sp. R77965 TaxID=3093872 RepID=UPI0037DC0B29
MPLTHLKDQFDFPEDVVYLNTASFSPAFKSVETAGVNAVKAKSRPDYFQSSDLFDPVIELRKLFTKIIDADDYNRVVTIPSVSYGMANAARNISLQKGDEILLVEEQFPSNVYIWKELADKFEAKIITVKQPEHIADWNHKILEAISEKTAVVAIAHIHWANGFIFDLKAIREKTKQHNALLIIDGSQSIGALPFSIKDIQPDALICAGYKWLFGPYGCAYAYYSDYFDHGKPIEENWSIRLGSENLSGLTQYQYEYKPKSQRYAAGESASFIYIKMQMAALKEILSINPQNLQEYCNAITEDALVQLKNIGFRSEAPELRAKHLFGIRIPRTIDLEKLKKELKNANIIVSFRGDYIRLSCHLFNTKAHFEKLVKTITLVTP